MTQGIVTKTGNSYALRVPKRYIDDNNLKLGDKVTIEEPLDKQQKALAALVSHGKKHGAIKSIPDPVAWQREQRAWKDRREKVEK
jgi:antitoxin component of MazEF toxin-antitoxin module